MELWIRNQDKNCLMKVEKLELINDCLCSEDVQLTHIETDKGIVGSYSPERALEVLDEIHQRLIDLQTIEITPDSYKTIKRNLNCVYEMPEN